MTNLTKPLLEVKQLQKSYVDHGKSTDVLKSLDFIVNTSDTAAIMGASGCGKSTLLHCLAGLDTFDSGEVILNHKNIQTLSERELCALRNQSVGFIYQFHHLLPEFNVLENIMMPLWLQGKNGVNKKVAYDLLDKVGLKDKAKQSIQTLSGGERQRVAIARALVNNPSIIFADEPTGNLDEDTAKQVMQLLLDLNQSMGCALVMVTHDKELAQMLQKQYRLNHGKLLAE